MNSVVSVLSLSFITHIQMSGSAYPTIRICAGCSEHAEIQILFVSYIRAVTNPLDRTWMPVNVWHTEGYTIFGC